MKQILLALSCMLVLPAVSFAQSTPGFISGQVVTAQQLNAAFAAKQDYPNTISISATAPIVLTGSTLSFNYGAEFTVTAGALRVATNGITFSEIAQLTNNSLLGNSGASTANLTAVAVPSCSSATNALLWTTNTGFSCNTSITASSVPASGITSLPGSSNNLFYNNSGAFAAATVGQGLALSGGALTANLISSSTFGVGKVDNATITAAAGILTVANTTINSVACTPGSSCSITATAASMTVGTTTIISGTTNNILYNNAGTLANGPISSFLTQGAGITLSGTNNVTVALTAPVTVALGGTNETSQTSGGIAYAPDATHLTTGSTLIWTGSLLGVGTSTVVNSGDQIAVQNSTNGNVVLSLDNPNTGTSALSEFCLGNNSNACGGSFALYGGNYTITALRNVFTLNSQAGIALQVGGADKMDYGVTNASAWTILSSLFGPGTSKWTSTFFGIGTTSPVNTNDITAFETNSNGVVSETIYNPNAGASAQTIFYLGNNVSVNEGQILVSGGGYSNAALQNTLVLDDEAGKFEFSNNGTNVADFGVTVSNAWTLTPKATIPAPLLIGGTGNATAFYNSSIVSFVQLSSATGLPFVTFWGYNTSPSGTVGSFNGTNLAIAYIDNSAGSGDEQLHYSYDTSLAQSLIADVQTNFAYIDHGHVSSDMEVDGYSPWLTPQSSNQTNILAGNGGCLAAYNTDTRSNAYPCNFDVKPTLYLPGDGLSNIGSPANRRMATINAENGSFFTDNGSANAGVTIGASNSANTASLNLKQIGYNPWSWVSLAGNLQLYNNWQTVSVASVAPGGGGSGCTNGTQTFTLNPDTNGSLNAGFYATVQGTVSGGVLSGSLTVVDGGAYSTAPGNGVQLIGASCTLEPTVNTTTSTQSAVMSATPTGQIYFPNLGTSSAVLDYACWNVATGQLTGDGSGLCSASSLRFKHDVHPLTDSLDVVMKIDPIAFIFNDQSSRKGPQEFVSAESVAAADPVMVTYDDEGKPLSPKIMALIGRLYGAVQEQQHEIEELRRGR